MERYKLNQIITYIPTNQRCRVVHNSLGPGGSNFAEALVTVLLPSRVLVNVPVEIQDAYLTTRPPRPTLKNGYGIFPDAVPQAGTQTKENPA